MDEVSVFVDLHLFSQKNPLALQLLGSRGETPQFDVVLSGLSDGTFLPPLLFFRGAPLHVPDDFPKNVLLETRRGGCSDQERLDTWTDKVWPRPLPPRLRRV